MNELAPWEQTGELGVLGWPLGEKQQQPWQARKLCGDGERSCLAHYLGAPRAEGSFRPGLPPGSCVFAGSPLGCAQRRALLAPPLRFLGRILLRGCFSWMKPLSDPSSPPQVPIKCSKYFLLLNKANKGEGSLEA